MNENTPENQSPLILTIGAYRDMVRETLAALGDDNYSKSKLDDLRSDYEIFQAKTPLPEALKTWIDDFNPSNPIPAGISDLQAHVSRETGVATRELRSFMKERGNSRADLPFEELAGEVAEQVRTKTNVSSILRDGPKRPGAREIADGGMGAPG